MIAALCLPDHLFLDGRVLKCSPQVWEQLGLNEEGTHTINFGSRSVEHVTIKKGHLKNEYLQIETDSYFIASTDIFEQLFLKERIRYRIRRREDGCIEIGPTIGFLMGDSPHSYTPEYMRKFMDRFSIYNEIQGFFCAFAEENINWDDHTVYGLYFNPNGNTHDEKWEYGIFPIPSVIYRRYFHNKEGTIERLKQITHSRVFNSSRFSKYEFYETLKKDPRLAAHLPKTRLLSLNKIFLRDFLFVHSEAILKPVDLSRGRGIFYIRWNKGREVNIIDHRFQHPVEIRLPAIELLSFLTREIPDPEKYIIQQLIPIVQVNSRPFDIRVVMQKDEKGDWICNGMEARHAVQGSYVTNLAKGGHATSVEEAIAQAFSADEYYIRLQIGNIMGISNRICRQIEQANPDHHFAEFGIDLGMDARGKTWIIEANVYPSFKGIKHFKKDQYMNIRYTPLRYAYAISGFDKNNGYNEKMPS